jgi:peptidoglycan hydrolase-like protein with peptidoglycan-binding domain
MKKRKSCCFVSIVVFLGIILSSITVSGALQVLQKGMYGQQVRSLQDDLRSIGYFKNKSTGYFGELTEATVIKLQGDYGYIQDGMVGKSTYSLIDRLTGRGMYDISRGVDSISATTVLKKGMRGNSVKALQIDLIELGLLNANATGYYGDLTEAAVRELQKSFGYKQDGVAGPDTISLIKRCLTSDTVTQSKILLKKGMRGIGVEALQADLKKLGFFWANVTGYYGDITEKSVINLQKRYGYVQDGIVGKSTFGLIDKLLGRKSVTASRSLSSSTVSAKQNNYMLPWFGGVENIFKKGMTATVYDVATGRSFKIKRSFGTNHADCETLTAEDTAIMKSIQNGEWSWARRAIIVDVNGTKIAASMNGMPHAGLDKYPVYETVYGHSGGYGKGTNLDAVKGNNMDGHFCVHFYNSRTHGTNRVDSNHQTMVKKAADWAIKNY